MRLPATQSLFYTLLLAEALPPSVHDQTFNLARVDALMRMGALDPALALLEQIGPDVSPAVFARYFDASLLAGTEDTACAKITSKPSLAPDYATRVFCAARAGDWDTAVLLLGTARALDAITEARADMLERFLDPDLFEGEPDLPTPAKDDPLSFRVFEAIGTPISGTNWRGWPMCWQVSSGWPKPGPLRTTAFWASTPTGNPQHPADCGTGCARCNGSKPR